MPLNGSWSPIPSGTGRSRAGSCGPSPDRAGNLLEIVVLLLDDGTDLIIHAMRMRSKYRDLLP